MEILERVLERTRFECTHPHVRANYICSVGALWADGLAGGRSA